MPTSASIVRSLTSGRRSAAFGSKVAGSRSRIPVAITRRPCRPRRSFSEFLSRNTSTDLAPGPVIAILARARSWSGAPYSTSDHVPAGVVCRLEVAISL